MWWLGWHELTPVQTARAARPGWSRHLCRHTHACTHMHTRVHAHTHLVLPARDRRWNRSPSPPSQPQQGSNLRPAPTSPNQPDPATAWAQTSPAGPWPHWQHRGTDGAAELLPSWQGRPNLAQRAPGVSSSPLLPSSVPVQAQAVFTPDRFLAAVAEAGTLITGPAALSSRGGSGPSSPPPGRGLFKDRTGHRLPADSEHPAR